MHKLLLNYAATRWMIDVFKSAFYYFFVPSLDDNERRDCERFLSEIYEKMVISNKSEYLFVDCGANTCRVLSYFIENLPEDFSFEAFEPQTQMRPFFNRVKRNHPNRKIHIHWAAIWTDDSELVLEVPRNYGKNLKGGASLLREKFVGKTHSCTKSMSVNAVDFSRWLEHRCHGGMFVAVKMDVEGAEYPILRKMINDGTIVKIDVLAVEFHGDKLDCAMSIEEKEDIESIRKQGVPVIMWH